MGMSKQDDQVDFKVEGADQFYEVYVRDFKNNVQIAFQFTSDDRYLQQSACCILMYDITNYQSFINLKKRYLELANNQMQKQLSFLYIVGNKMDMDINPTDSQKVIEMIEGQRQVEFEEAQEFAQTKGILFNEVSSLKRKNIELVLKMLRTRTARLLSEYKDLHLVLDNIGPKPSEKKQKQASVKDPEEEEEDEDLYSKFEHRLISQEERAKKSNQNSNLNTLQSALVTSKNLDTAHFGQDNEDDYNRRQLLNQILESKYYKSNESQGVIIENAKDQSMSLGEINQQNMYNFEYQRKNELEGLDIDYGLNETDNMEDDKLLKSLEKKLRNLDEKKNTYEEEQSMGQQFAIRTDESPDQFQQDQLYSGQTPQFMVPQQKKSSNILDELSNALKKYQDDTLFTSQEEKEQKALAKNPNHKKNDSRISNHQPNNSFKRDQNDSEFLKNLDSDIRKTEESLKEMNDRFNRIKQQQILNSSSSPLGKRMTNSISPLKLKDQSSTPIKNSSSNKDVPIFEASLFKSFDQRTQNTIKQVNVRQSSQITGHSQKSRNQHQVGLLTDRSSRNQLSSSFIGEDHKEKPLISLRIKLSPTQYVSANIYKDDTAQTVADRVFRHTNLKPNRENKDQRKLLAQIIEEKVNGFIIQAKEQFDIEQKENKKSLKFQQQQEREKRLHEAAQKSINSLNTAKRLAEKEEKKQRVIGKLSVIVGANKKGDIVVREGDNIQQLVKNFMVSYGLKRDLMPTIIESLEKLIRNNEMKKNTQPFYGAGQNSLSMEEHEIKFAEDQEGFNSFMNNKQHSPFRSNESDGQQNLFNQLASQNRIDQSMENKKGLGSLLFRLNFELGEGKSAKINVREGDNFNQLAQSFAQQHGLGEEAIGKVLHLIEQTYRIHKQKQTV